MIIMDYKSGHWHVNLLGKTESGGATKFEAWATYEEFTVDAAGDIASRRHTYDIKTVFIRFNGQSITSDHLRSTVPGDLKEAVMDAAEEAKRLMRREAP